MIVTCNYLSVNCSLDNIYVFLNERSLDLWKTGYKLSYFLLNNTFVFIFLPKLKKIFPNELEYQCFFKRRVLFWNYLWI